jgi:ABC-type uncharacterized transport system permease subunit
VIADVFGQHFDLTDVILIIGIVGVIVGRVGEGRGWFKSAAGLRSENTDLLRRNGELEATTLRHEETIRAQGEKIVRLEEQVRSLEKLDQTAVLVALRDHEIGATARAEETHRLLGESTLQLVRIATVLENTGEENP